MSIILTTAIMTVMISLVLYKPIHKYKWFLYSIAVIISIIAMEDANVLSLGYIPFGIFLVVMYTGVLDKGVIRKRLSMVRAELAITASILLVPHAYGYLEYFLDDIGFINSSISFYFGILAVLLIIPLFITSFQYIRRKMNYKQWKHLHRYAYIIYAIIGCHLILIQNDRMWLYLIVFGLYYAFKLPTILPRPKRIST